MLKLSNVSAGYNGKNVIHNISFQLEKGENLCIIGPNGCGKTTLLKAIARLIPSTGQIFIDNKPLEKMKRKEISLKLALLSQISTIYFSYSILDTVMFGRYLHTKSGIFNQTSDKDIEIVENALRAVDLYSIKDKSITTLSGGQLQRVFLARTLAQEPEIILLDEPTNHLDLKYQIELIDFLKKWSVENNRSIVGVIHDLNLAMYLSENLMVLNNGIVEAHGNATEIIKSKMINKIYDMDITKYMKNSFQKWDIISGCQ